MDHISQSKACWVLSIFVETQLTKKLRRPSRRISTRETAQRNMRSRSRSRPRIFKGRGRSKSVSGKTRRGTTATAVQSIGSELSEQDQFDIIVSKQVHRPGSVDRRSRSSIWNYFNSEIDATTVSTLTVDEYQQHYTSAYAGDSQGATSASASTSWCCCSDTTQPTTTTSTAAADYNTLVYYDGDELDRMDALNGDTVAPPRRPRIKFGGWRRGTRKTSEMSPSLFDALQEEDPYNEEEQRQEEQSRRRRRRSRSMGAFFSKRSSNKV